MSNRNLCILAAILIIAASFANINYKKGQCRMSAAEMRQYNDSVMRNDIRSDYEQRIVRTVRCLVAAGTPPSLVTRRVQQLYDEMEQQLNEEN